jgi:hypothetical protein
VYDAAVVSIAEVLQAKRDLASAISLRLNLPLHFCTLSEAEADRTAFIEAERAQEIFVWI